MLFHSLFLLTSFHFLSSPFSPFSSSFSHLWFSFQFCLPPTFCCCFYSVFPPLLSFSFLLPPVSAPSPTQVLFFIVSSVSIRYRGFPRVRWPEGEANQSPHPLAYTVCRFTATSTVFNEVLHKHGGKFIFMPYLHKTHTTERVMVRVPCMVHMFHLLRVTSGSISEELQAILRFIVIFLSPSKGCQDFPNPYLLTIHVHLPTSFAPFYTL
jgi:hypothetical protein